ncbi:MAG: QueT transporter family protein [Oscillospiraceae bacterium]|nr:QueT transporter family protein [Oscillospiraceae bacterium]
MSRKSNTLRCLAEGGMIAAMYTALTLVIPAASFGLTQFRVAEILTILPIFSPAAIPGLTVGCMISNIIGLSIGANLAGAWDILFGSLATLIAGLLTYYLRNIRLAGLPILSTLPPVLINAAVIGLELTLALFTFSWKNYAIAFFNVGIGQLAACTVCGLVLFVMLNRTGAARHIFNRK